MVSTEGAWGGEEESFQKEGDGLQSACDVQRKWGSPGPWPRSAQKGGPRRRSQPPQCLIHQAYGPVSSSHWPMGLPEHRKQLSSLKIKPNLKFFKRKKIKPMTP